MSKVHSKWIGDEHHTKLFTREQFNRWCKRGGWEGVVDFEQRTGVQFEELQGKWFTVVNDRVFIKSPIDVAWIGGAKRKVYIPTD